MCDSVYQYALKRLDCITRLQVMSKNRWGYFYPRPIGTKRAANIILNDEG